MSDDERAPGAPAETPASGAPWVPLAAPDAAWPPPGPALPRPPRRIALAGLALALLGLAALLLGQVEAALYLVAATLCFVAQAADAHPALGRLYAFLGWMPPALTAFLLSAIAILTLGDVPLAAAGARLGVAAFAGLGAAACLALLLPPVADACARRLFRAAAPGHMLRLSAAFVVGGLWAGPAMWFVARDLLPDLLADPADLVAPDALAGSLVGAVALALAAVGLHARRGWREALARLGLARPRAADALTVLAATVALWLLNSGAEWLERAWLPELWRHDNAFGVALAGAMGPGRTLLLGLSAGVGEEITLRGALQPKLGIFLTALLFAVLHVQYSWFGMLTLLLFGVLLGLVRRHSNTTVVIAVHALYDVLAVATARP
jgi:hypothetical protein